MMKINDLRTELDDLNRDLAELTDRAPLGLRYQTGDSDKDALFLYGIVGGKDVGKTSLINQLAGARISIDTDILDEGTRKAVAYCHESDRAALQKRLSADMGGRIDYAVHNRDVLRNVVLIDFPDYDSRFVEHRDDVRRLSRFLQGLVWIITPRKYGDHEFIDQLEAVAQSHEYYLIVLNKTDQLDGRVPLETARREILGYLKDECSKRDIPAPTGDRLIMVSALNPKQYEYPRLYERLIRRHSPEEILRAKVDNLRTEFNKNLSSMQEYYALDDRIAELDDALEEIAVDLREHFNDDYFETVWRRVLALGPVQHRISHGLFFQRVQHWPILRMVFYPLSGLISFIGVRLSFSKSAEDISESPRDLLRSHGNSASSQLQAIRAAVEENHPDLLPYLDDAPNFAEPVEKNFRRLIDSYEDRVVRRIAATIPKPGPIRKSLVFLPLVWFPLIQPFLFEWSRSEESLLSLGGMRELVTILISLFGAGALLQSAVFLVVFYLIWLVILYARGARRALLEGEEEFGELWHEEFLPLLSRLLSHPFQSIRTGWMDKRARLEKIQSEMMNELNRIERTH